MRTCGAFPPTAALWAPHRSRSHGRLRRPKSLSIRHSPAAALCSSPWAGGITPVLTSWLHRFASLGLKSRIDAQIALVLTSLLHRFASLGLKSGIDARIAPLLTSLLHRFASLGLKSRIDAHHRAGKYNCPPSASRCCYDAASDSIFLCRKVEQSRLRKPVVAVLNGPPAAVVAALMNCPPSE